MLFLRKKIIILIIFVITLGTIVVGKTVFDSKSTTIELTSQEHLIERTLLKMLYPYIQRSIADYYGYNKQFMDDRILEISKYGPYDIKIKLQVTTFEGPHNPPYGIEFITLVVGDKVEIIDFDHQDKPPKN